MQILLKPGNFRGECFAAKSVWSKKWTCDWREVCLPEALGVGLDVTGTGDRERAERDKVELFAVNTGHKTRW